MVENVIVAAAVIVAFYFVIRFILKRLAGSSEAVNPCQGCSGCSLGAGSASEGCTVASEKPDRGNSS